MIFILPSIFNQTIEKKRPEESPGMGHPRFKRKTAGRISIRITKIYEHLAAILCPAQPAPGVSGTVVGSGVAGAGADGGNAGVGSQLTRPCELRVVCTGQQLSVDGHEFTVQRHY